ncbi:hypothetical protein CBR_g17645 [Chara braunii]|uniref:Myb-like domain-containing protein n=1 Tax=Chara braunii TaxID=69332 RepID=A0A388KV34_CHABU|nr:hypothetical protein CBR_g17645 [Chara braunii]|eukprot:GBG73930.1 hypothetical protein CBR_g17645 [Chara braunii]
MGCRSSPPPAALSLTGHTSRPLSLDPFRGAGLPHPPRPRTGSPEYVMSRIIRDKEAGVPPVDCPANTAVGGEVVASPTAPARTPPQRGSFEGGGTPSPLIGHSASQHTPRTVENLAGTSTAGPSEGPPPRPCSTEKNTDRWGETETEWLCRFRNDMKALGCTRLKACFWKDVVERMRAKGYNRNPDQCKNKFNQILDYYRRLKAHESWSGLLSYWDMNQTRRKKYNVSFVLRRAWYDIIHPVEKDKDSINLTNLMDSGVDEEHLEDSERCNEVDGETEGGSEGPAGGSDSSPGGPDSSPSGQHSTGFDPMLGKRKRTAINARESSLQAVIGAMRDHTAALACSDRECVKMRCEVTRDIARHQAEVHRELMQQDIASRERIATITGDRLEKGYLVLADAIHSLRPRRNSPSSGPDSSDSQ